MFSGQKQTAPRGAAFDVPFSAKAGAVRRPFAGPDGANGGYRLAQTQLKHFPAKWVPVRVKKTRQINRASVPIQSERKRLWKALF
jgi:hypothetical protein